MQESDGLDFDLGKYIEILVRQWMLILATILVCALAAAIISFRKPVSYEASVIVSSAKLGSVVTFGSTIETISEGQGYINIVDRKARLQSFIALVKNPLIAQRVYEDLRVEFGDKTPEPDGLIDRVSASLMTGSDSIEIVVKNGSPELALAIANAWGERYVGYINDLYTTGGALSTTSNIQAQIDEAYQAYLSAQDDYVVFLSSSPLNEYTRMAEEFLRIGQVLEDARSLREQVSVGGEESASSNALVLSLLKTKAFAATPVLENYQFQIAPASSSTDALLGDVDNLIAALEDRYSDLEGRIDSLVGQGNVAAVGSGNSLSASSTAEGAGSEEILSLSRAEQNNRLLLARAEHENGQMHEKQLARDLAWKTYSNLATKVVELEVAAQTGGYEVVLGSPAIESEKVNNSTQPIFLAAIVGLLVGVFSAFGIEYWWGYKGIEAQPILFASGRKRGG